MSQFVFFDLAARVPTQAQWMIGLGLDAMRMSAEPNALLIGGAGGRPPARFDEAHALIQELSSAEAKTDEMTKWWAAIPTDAEGILHQRFGEACRDLVALADAGCDEDIMISARNAFATTIEAYLHSLRARISGEEWTATAMRMQGELSLYMQSYTVHGGMSTLLLAFVVVLSLGTHTEDGWSPLPAEESEKWATDRFTAQEQEAEAVREKDDLLESLTACHRLSLAGAVARELSGNDHALAYRAEESRRAAEEVLFSCGASLLNGTLNYFSKLQTVNLARTFVSSAMVRAMREADTNDSCTGWSALRVTKPEYEPLALAVDARRGPFVPGPNR